MVRSIGLRRIRLRGAATVVAAVMAAARNLRNRILYRRHLRRLSETSDHLLRDIGLDPTQVRWDLRAPRPWR